MDVYYVLFEAPRWLHIMPFATFPWLLAIVSYSLLAIWFVIVKQLLEDCMPIVNHDGKWDVHCSLDILVRIFFAINLMCHFYWGVPLIHAIWSPHLVMTHCSIGNQSQTLNLVKDASFISARTIKACLLCVHTINDMIVCIKDWCQVKRSLGDASMNPAFLWPHQWEFNTDEITDINIWWPWSIDGTSGIRELRLR